MPDNNSSKLILQQFRHHFGMAFCHYAHLRVYCNMIRLIKADMSHLQQHASNLPFLFLCVNFRQSLRKYYENFKKCVENSPSPPIQCCEPITLLDASFAHCSSTLLREGRGEKNKIVQIAVFPIIFVTDYLKNCKMLVVVFYSCSI